MEKIKLPNGTAVLVLGILSIVSCCCYGIIGLILGIVALILAKKDLVLIQENPDLYANVGNLKTGRILAIIGIILNVLFGIFIVWLISVIGYENLENEEVIKQKMMELMQ